MKVDVMNRLISLLKTGEKKWQDRSIRRIKGSHLLLN